MALARSRFFFCIHGGGWVYGTKELISYYAMDMCTRGFAVINLSYRLLPEVGLYEQLSDIFRAYCYAEKLPDTSLRSKMDFTRVYLAGDREFGAQGAMLHEVLQNANIPHDFLYFDGPEGLQMGHTYNVSYFDQPRAQEINRTCAEFLLSH